MLRLLCALSAALLLTACGTTTQPSASAVEVARAAYVHDGPASLTLFTVRKVSNGSGAHTGLMINGSQRVMWDPAGSFVHPSLPEVGDVVYGITPMMERVYIDYHVRPEFDMIVQELPVSQAVADRVAALARNRGAAARSTCARSTSSILREAGIDVGVTWFPNALAADFGALPGVTERRITVNNVDTNHNVIFGKGGVPLPPGA